MQARTNTWPNLCDHCWALIVGIIRKELINIKPTDFMPADITKSVNIKITISTNLLGIPVT